MEYILGVDGGGSKTNVMTSDLKGKVISQAVSGSSSYKSIGKSRAIENLNKGILKALKGLNITGCVHFASSCFGFAGNDTEEDYKTYNGIVYNNKLAGHINPGKIIICNDTRIGLEAGSENKNKIILISGTGSNCFGINEEGMQARASGWDHILGDEGSGYWVGLKALRSIMRAYDGRGEKTLLTKTILKELNLKKVLDLTKWAYNKPFLKNRIGLLAKTVCATADMGDKISIDILAEAAEEVAISAITVIKKLDLENKNFDLVFVGGLFRCEKHFKDVLVERLKGNFLQINYITLLKDPVEGAIKLAIKNLKDSGR